MSEPESRPPLSGGQLEVMNVVWDRGEVTVADVWRELSGRRALARNTILTTVTRLEEKGWLCRVGGGHAFRYKAAAPREATLGALVRRLVETTFGGSAENLVHALLHGRGVSGAEAEKIRAMIDRAEGKP